MTNCDNVLFSMVSYRRNIKDMLFVNKLSDMELAISITRSLSDMFGENFEFKSLKNISLKNCMRLEEDGILTKEMIENKDISAFGLGYDNVCKILVNEEDHIRLVAKAQGLCLEEMFEKANEMDDVVLDKLEMAFDSEIGYLTANPNLFGTGLEVLCGMFLPALVFGGKFLKIMTEIKKGEYQVLGLDGGEWNKKSPFVIIKNKYTFGKKENEIAQDLQELVNKLISLEKNEENSQFDLSASTLADSIFRGFGVMSSAYRMAFDEAEELVGKVLWGVLLKILVLKQRIDFLELLNKIKENNLSAGNIKETEKQRAKILRESSSKIFRAELDL